MRPTTAADAQAAVNHALAGSPAYDPMNPGGYDPANPTGGGGSAPDPAQPLGVGTAGSQSDGGLSLTTVAVVAAVGGAVSVGVVVLALLLVARSRHRRSMARNSARHVDQSLSTTATATVIAQGVPLPAMPTNGAAVSLSSSSSAAAPRAPPSYAQELEGGAPRSCKRRR